VVTLKLGGGAFGLI